MTAISWKSAQSGSWTDPNDWTPGQVPGPGDDTTIGVSGSYTVSLSSATPTTVDSLTIGDANATFGIDAQQFSPGGTSLTVTGTLTNAGIINLGRSGLPASDTLSVRALSNTGTINLIGGSTGTADLLIGSAAPSTLTGSLSLSADALVEYESGGITTIGSGASLTLIGANAWGGRQQSGEQESTDRAVEQSRQPLCRERRRYRS